jgi:hypothetical protein
MYGSWIDKSIRHNQAILGEHFAAGDDAGPEPKAAVGQDGVIAGPQQREVLPDAICNLKV